MKNVFFILCIIFVSLLMFLDNTGSKGELRVRVIGASDEKKDVENKMAVAENTLKMLEKERFKTISEAEDFIENNFDLAKSVAEETLLKRGCEDKVEVFLRDEYYENEKKAEKSFVIVIGEGRGHNFFTTLFPKTANKLSSVSENAKGFSFTFIQDGKILEARFKILDFLCSVLE